MKEVTYTQVILVTLLLLKSLSGAALGCPKSHTGSLMRRVRKAAQALSNCRKRVLAQGRMFPLKASGPTPRKTQPLFVDRHLGRARQVDGDILPKGNVQREGIRHNNPHSVPDAVARVPIKIRGRTLSVPVRSRECPSAGIDHVRTPPGGRNGQIARIDARISKVLDIGLQSSASRRACGIHRTSRAQVAVRETRRDRTGLRAANNGIASSFAGSIGHKIIRVKRKGDFDDSEEHGNHNERTYQRHLHKRRPIFTPASIPGEPALSCTQYQFVLSAHRSFPHYGRTIC